MTCMGENIPGHACMTLFIGPTTCPMSCITLYFTFHSPDLTWRDVQYLLVYTSDSSRLVDSWATNGAGLRFSHKHGYGAIDAEALVTRGRHWITVPPQISDSVLPAGIARWVCGVAMHP